MQKDLPDSWEKIVGQKLKSLQPDWDEELIWLAIENDLEKSKQPTIVWWWFSLLLIPLLVSDTMLLTPIKLDSFKILTPDVIKKENTIAQDERVKARAASVFLLEKKGMDLGDRKPQKDKNEAKNQLNPMNVEKEATNQEVSMLPTFTATPLVMDSANSKLPIHNKNSISLSIKPLQTLRREMAPFSIPLAIQNPKLIQPVSKQSIKQLSLETYTGISKPFRKFESPSNNLMEYTNLREVSEKVLESVEFGIAFRLRVNSSWSFGLGLERQQITERFQWEFLEEEVIAIQSDSTFYYFDENQVKKFIGGELEGIKTTARNVTNYNRYTLYNLPFDITFHNRSGALGYFMKFGAVLNLSQQFQGKIFDSNDQILTTEEIEEREVFKSSIGRSFQLGVGMEYLLSDGNQIFVEGYYRFDQENLTNFEVVGYKQNYSFGGMRLGFRKLF